jgi:hypothetical protein
VSFVNHCPASIFQNLAIRPSIHSIRVDLKLVAWLDKVLIPITSDCYLIEWTYLRVSCRQMSPSESKATTIAQLTGRPCGPNSTIAQPPITEPNRAPIPQITENADIPSISSVPVNRSPSDISATV